MVACQAELYSNKANCVLDLIKINISAIVLYYSVGYCYTVSHQTTTVTVDRISNSGNAIAKSQVQGKTVHAPVTEVGRTLEVELIDQGSHFEAKLVDTSERTQPSQPSVSPNTADLSKGRSSTSDSHSYSVGKSASGSSGSQGLSSWMSSRKL